MSKAAAKPIAAKPTAIPAANAAPKTGAATFKAAAAKVAAKAGANTEAKAAKSDAPDLKTLLKTHQTASVFLKRLILRQVCPVSAISP